MRSLLQWALTITVLASVVCDGVLGAPPAKLNCMVVSFGVPDYKLGAGGRSANTSACTEQVDRVAERCSLSSIKINPYFYFSWTLPADAKPEDSKDYRFVITGWKIKDATYNVVPVTQAAVDEYVTDFGYCLKYAASKGFKEIYISPMVDPDDYGVYRNYGEIQPLELYADAKGVKWSYETMIVKPSIEAIKPVMAANPSLKWRFSLGAELGRAFTFHAPAWQTLAKNIRTGLGNPKKNRLQVGPNFNWNGLCGQWCGNYNSLNKTGISVAQFTAFRAFLLSPYVDFVGTSHYPNVWDAYDPLTKRLDHYYAIRKFDEEITQFASPDKSFNLATLRKAGKAFILNEAGFGGCLDYNCDGTTTKDIYDLAKYPWNGIGHIEDYEGNHKYFNPFRYAWQKAFRMEWYRQFFQLLKSGMPPYQVQTAYLWVVGSWDFAGVYADSYRSYDLSVGCDPQKAFCDPELLSLTARYNADPRSLPRTPFFNLPGPKYYVQP